MAEEIDLTNYFQIILKSKINGTERQKKDRK